MRKIKIALVITLSEHGGAQRHVLDLVQRLMSRYEYLVVVGTPGWLVDQLSLLGVACAVVPTLGRDISGVRDLRAFCGLQDVLRQYRPQVLHLHSSKAGLIGRLVGFRLGIPVVYTVHGWGFKPGVPTARRFVVWAAEFLFSRLAKRIICVSLYDAQLAKVALPGVWERVTMIWNGIPDLHLKKTNHYRERLRVLMVARFQEPKLQGLLIDSVAMLRDSCRVDLIFAGDGPLRHSVEARATAIGSKATFLGSRDDVPALLADTDVCVLLSTYEGLPICIIEAMRAGVPVVASKVGGVPELVVDGVTGLLVSNVEASVAEALQRLNDDPDLRIRLGLAARSRYEHCFSVGNMADKVSEVYAGVIN